VTSPPNRKPLNGRVLATLGAILEDAQNGRLPEGWIYLPKTDDLRVDTPCMLVTDLDLARDERSIPAVAVEQGFEVEGLDKQMSEDVVAWARQFQDPPGASLMLEGFIYYWKYDAFPERPGAGPPPPWEDVQRRLDREFYDTLGAERPHTTCRQGGCAKGTIEHSVMCRVHHFEMIKKRPCPFTD
jgi:hypothetical protein